MLGLSILVIEDHASISTYVGFYLRQGGNTVTVATSLAEAKAAVGAESFDLILADNPLPDGEVVSITRELKPNTPCIAVMSGMPDLAEYCQDAGVDRTLTKPFLPADLDALLAEVAAAKGE
jgi:two-component system capsular synthesis sensor histidine kinase RcsC